MPELSEVEITCTKLLPLVVGRKILDFSTDWRRGLKSTDGIQRVAKSINGRKILGVKRHGKVLFFKLSGTPEREMAVHLRMSGRLLVRSSAEPPSKWAHFIWKLSGGKELRFVDPRKFGMVWYGSPEDFKCDPYLGRLGPDAKNISRETFHKVFHRATGAIKPFLLKQDRIAGIGNIIADESLWRAKIHPHASVFGLSREQRDALLSALRFTLTAMLASGGTTLRDWGHPDGGKGSFQDIRQVYGKAGLPCPRCRRTLVRSVVGGRGTTTCPGCQKH